MNRLEYHVAAAVLRLLGWIFGHLPVRSDRVVLATARVRALEGNLLHLHRAIRAERPALDVVLLLEPYSYGLLGKLRYAVRLARGMYHVQTAGLIVVDNAFLPIHVAPHRPQTTVVQVWHAVGALKRFGFDTLRPPEEPERTFLHRYYDYAVSAGEASREPWARAFRLPIERVLPLGAPRTDFFFDAPAMAAARERLIARHPELDGRRVIVYAPTFRGRGRGKRPSPGLDPARLRATLPSTDVLVLKSHPNLDRRLVSTAGYDVVIDPSSEINELLAMTDILITDYSSSIFEYALLRRPLITLVGDLAEYEREPGLYLDYRSEMIGRQVTDTDGVIAAIRAEQFELSGYDAFIAAHLAACDGHASARFVDRFLPRP